MAKNREMLKEAIAEAKAVKEMAIANAKAALEEAFTPQLKSMLSLKLQEMEAEDEDLKEYAEEYEDSATGKRYSAEDVTEEKDEMMEVDLEELLAELELEEGEDGTLNEAEEEGEEEGEEEEGGEEGEPLDLEDMTDEDLKKMIEDVIAEMIASGELEAGEGEEGEEEGEEAEMSDEEEVDLAELLKEIEEMEEPVDEAEGAGLPSGSEAETAIEKLKAAVKNGVVSQEELKALGQAGKEEVGDDDMLAEAEGEDLKAVIKQDIENLKKDRRILKIAEKIGISAAALGMAAFAYGVSQDMGEVASAGVNQIIDMAPAAIAGLVSLIGGGALGLGSAAKAYSKGQDIAAKEKELEEAYATIESLKSELNEINLLNAKLLFSNKIFKAKNLNENQKVKVLSSFDKAKTVGEVKMVFETLNEGIKVKKETIKENLGRASKSTVTPAAKQPIVESNDVFKRMQKLAGII